MDTKTCNTCGETKQRKAFTNDKAIKDGLARRCRQCARNSQMIVKYGLDQDSYNRLVDAQGGRCAICGVVPDYLLAVDHDHSCCPGRKTCGECIRGLLCHKCNRGIGYLNDSPEIVHSALSYLEEWKT